jgi:hypothetical protein
MANNPPPYADITGITRAAMKDNAQESIENYNGVARPGELVVDQLTDSLYVGDPQGNLTLVGPTLLQTMVDDNDITLGQSNQNQQIILTTNSTVYVPINADVPLPIGYAVTLVSGDSGNNYLRVVNGPVLVYVSGQDVNPIGNSGGTDAHNDYATLLKYSMYALLKVDTDTWILSGPGITESYC